MADVAVIPDSSTAAAALKTKKTKVVAAKPAVKKVAAKATHPRSSDMVIAAVKSLKERGGSSLQAIKKYIASNYKVDAEKLAPFIKKAIKQAVVSGALVQTKGKGASGSFKLPSVEKAEKKKTPASVAAKAKKTKAKKVVAAKPVKPAAKKLKAKASPKKVKAVVPASPKKAVVAKPKVVKAKAKAPVKAKPAPKTPAKAKKPVKGLPTKKPKTPKPKKAVAKKVAARKSGGRK